MTLSNCWSFEAILSGCPTLSFVRKLKRKIIPSKSQGASFLILF
jgi:hypothetical protein